MAAQNVNVFQSDITELSPNFTRPKSPHNAPHDYQASVAPGENKSVYNSDATSSQSSATATNSTTVAGERTSEPAATMPDASIASTASSENVKLSYWLNVYDRLNSRWLEPVIQDEAFDFSRINKPSNKYDFSDGTPEVFWVFITVAGVDERGQKGELDGNRDWEQQQRKLPPLKFEDLKVEKVKEVFMEIYSQPLLEAIRQVVDYYPNQNLSGDVVLIHEPYCVLIHHEKELRKLHQKLSSHGKERTSVDIETVKHLEVLLDFLKPHFDRIVLPIERRLQNKVPTIDFDSLWYLLRPGILAYCQYAGEWIGCVIMGVKGQVEENSGKITQWNIQIWFLRFSGGLGRAFTHSSRDPYSVSMRDQIPETGHYIARYEGEKDVTSLEVVPREYWDSIDNGARRERFEARGAMKMEMMNPRFQQMSHKGESIEKKKRLYHGRVIIDDQVDIQVYGKPDTLWDWGGDWALQDYIWMNKRGTGSSQRISKLIKLLDLEDNDPKNLSKDQAWLMSPDVSCFALDIKSWCTTHVDRLEPVEESAIPAQPVMEESDLKIIKSLTASQTSGKSSWAADSIKNKGKGVIILLHGPPGVGKTYSVEYTAMQIRRPLLALTIADIGSGESSIENELTSWFYLAERWKAVLLIDEADIFLERRKHTDFARNGLVSAFLRKMEYISGLLFLTTNRVGHIDEAFMSRVHVVIGYPQLDDAKRRELWEGFFRRMRTDTKGNIRVLESAREYVKQDSKALHIKLNGREIRNALQTAISLAEFEAKEDPDYSEDDKITVAKDHFERVLNMNRSFKVYLNSIKHNTEETRARNLYGRNDNCDDPEEKLE